MNPFDICRSPLKRMQNLKSCLMMSSMFLSSISLNPLLLWSTKFQSKVLSKHTGSSTCAAGWDDVGHFAWGFQPVFVLCFFFCFFHTVKPLLHTSTFPHVEFSVCLVGCDHSTEASFFYVNQSIFVLFGADAESPRGTHKYTHTQVSLLHLWALKHPSVVPYHHQTWN